MCSTQRRETDEGEHDEGESSPGLRWRHTEALSHMTDGLSKSVEDEFSNACSLCLPASPVDEGREAWITEFGKTIGKIIEHSFYPLLTLFKIPRPGPSLRMA